jgi:hypothetical protein
MSHVVQLYGTDDRALTKNVSRFLLDGLNGGDGLVVIATIEHIGGFVGPLRNEAAYQEAVRNGWMAFLDAQAMLSRYMVSGQPDRDRFVASVGEALQRVRDRAPSGGVRAYGEMVGILWAAGQRGAAIRVEGYWNALLRSTSCSLFCAYPIDVFSRDFQRAAVAPLLSAHSRLLPTNGRLASAVDQAMHEVLGADAEELRPLTHLDGYFDRTQIPRAEATVLWLRDHLPERADEILGRAREVARSLI